MRKFLKALLALTTVLTLVPTAVFADENIVEKPSDSNNTQGSIELYATKASSYSVKLPKSVDVSNDEVTFKVFAFGDIDAATELKVDKGTGTHALKDEANGKTDIDLTISVDKTFKYDDLGSDFAQDKFITFTITHNPILAGTYKYDLPIVISLVTAQQ